MKKKTIPVKVLNVQFEKKKFFRRISHQYYAKHIHMSTKERKKYTRSDKEETICNKKRGRNSSE